MLNAVDGSCDGCGVITTASWPTPTTATTAVATTVGNQLRATKACPPALPGCNTGAAGDISPTWPYYKRQSLGIDVYGFRVFPTSFRNTTGTTFTWNGGAAFWTANTGQMIGFAYNQPGAKVTTGVPVTNGYSVRCVK
jgi:uncharacterized protein (TIGR02145 family)